jgi:hypothetical protein
MTAEEARRLWAAVLDGVGDGDSICDRVLWHVERSVLIDIIEGQMKKSDTFAITIGRRVQTLTSALEATDAD